jgi:hypothetical protein
MWQLLYHVKVWQDKFHVLQTKKKFNKVETQISSFLHNVKGNGQNWSVTTFTSCKSVIKQLSHCANEKEVEQSRNPNITLPLLHNVEVEGQNQSVTTFTSCKSMTRQVYHIVQTKKKFNKIRKTKYHFATFTQCKRGQPKPKCDNFISCKSMTRQVSHWAKANKVQHRGKPNIILPPLHDVKGDSQSQSVTTFTSCKSMTRQVPCFANKKEVQHGGKPNI